MHAKRQQYGDINNKRSQPSYTLDTRVDKPHETAQKGLTELNINVSNRDFSLHAGILIKVILYYRK